MTHREFIAFMEQNEAGKAIFSKYKQLYSQHKQPVTNTGNVSYFIDNDQYITMVEKLLQHHKACVEKLAHFANLKEKDYHKVINYLEDEEA
jgi:hypothetical protein